MSKHKKEDAIPTVTLGTNNSSVKDRNNLIGKFISINQKIESYFGVGNIWLTNQNYYTEIPDNLSDEEYEIISKSLADGTIVLGKQFIPPIERNKEVLEEYWQALKPSGFNLTTKLGVAARAKFTNLVKRNTDRGYTSYEVSAYCLNKEIQGSARSDVMRLLKEVIDSYDGEKTLFKEPDTKN